MWYNIQFRVKQIVSVFCAFSVYFVRHKFSTLENKGSFCFCFSLGVHQLYHTDTFSYFMHVCVHAHRHICAMNMHWYNHVCVLERNIPMSVITMQVSHFAVLFMIILLKPCWIFLFFLILSSMHVQYHVYIHIYMYMCV